MDERLQIKPITLKKAGKFISQFHRHNTDRANGKFAISAWLGDVMVGVATAGRPSSRHWDDGVTLEIYRVCCLDGYKNANSFLLQRTRRIGQQMGYKRWLTFTLETESGASLRAIGAVADSVRDHNREWNDDEKRGIKRRPQLASLQTKIRWTGDL